MSDETKNNQEPPRPPNAGCYTFLVEWTTNPMQLDTDEQRECFAKLIEPTWSFQLTLPFKPSAGDELQIFVDEMLFIARVETVRVGVSLRGNIVKITDDDQHELTLSMIGCV